MTKVRNAKEFFSNSSNVDRLRVCTAVIETCDKLAPNFKIMRILHKLEGDDLNQLMQRINKTENDDLNSIIEVIVKNHDNEIAECLEKIKD